MVSRPSEASAGPDWSVVVDAFALSSAGADTGVGTYTRSLLTALAGEAPRTSGTVWALADPAVDLPAGVGRLTVRRRATRARAEVIEHALRLPADVLRRRPPGAVFHNPGFHAPAGVSRPWVQSLLDVIPLVADDPDLAALRDRWRRFGPRYRRADVVVAISQHAADEGIRVLGLDPTTVVVAPLGVDPRFRPGPGNDPSPYLLSVGQHSRRKRFDLAFSVLDHLVEQGLPHRLKVAGADPGWSGGGLARQRAQARHPDRITLCGRVPDVVPYYQGADVVLVTSSHEGFGLPALEAMACGVPVVAFANSALSEVVGSAGVLVDDGDVGAMAAAVSRILGAPGWADELRSRGLERASRYTWARTAALHIDAYRRAARGRSR